MHVKELANELGINPDTIRYYTRIGLLKPTKDSSGYKIFSDPERRHLRFAIRAKQLGFSLADVRETIELADTGRSPCPRVRELMAKNMSATDRSFREMQALRRRMHKALDTWADMPDAHPDGDMICTLIEDWDKKDG